MNPIENLKDLFIRTCKELYDASVTEERELIRLQENACNEQLMRLLAARLRLSNFLSEHVKDVLREFDEIPEGEKNSCSHVLLKQCREMMEGAVNREVSDAVIVMILFRLNYNRMAELSLLTSYSRELGHPDVSDAFFHLFGQHKQVDQDLCYIAEKEVNSKAFRALPV